MASAPTGGVQIRCRGARIRSPNDGRRRPGSSAARFGAAVVVEASWRRSCGLVGGEACRAGVVEAGNVWLLEASVVR
uniref:Uncharacterized protein n=1 Tax=Oryza sativa subsp. japonica TaxID=39947 RepID=Q7XI59_ORYSJ|nr:hypothetical protein [Oryza sativa Japonica Group]